MVMFVSPLNVMRRVDKIGANNANCKIKDTCLRFTYVERASQNATLHTFTFTPEVKNEQTICKGFVYDLSLIK